ncbi:energy transducer TonB [Desulfovibrio sp.]|uniref:energy transducer TonB n=1 Tax=Desulfovibrio sp. TaxID=885 RepID=UPI0025BD58A3|nr:energy transducer TonB [Desulfovibrio sp.]
MSFLKFRLAPKAFSLLLHGAILWFGLLFAAEDAVPPVQVYHVSLAEFAPAAPLTEEAVLPSPASSDATEPPLEKAAPETVKPPVDEVRISAKKRPQKRPEKPVERAPRQTPEPQPRHVAGTPQAPLAAGGPASGSEAQDSQPTRPYAEDAVDQRPSISRRAMPVYPDSARRKKLQGRVLVQLVVDTDGKPQRCVVITSTPEGVFDDAALAAAKKTRFVPGKVNGRPVNTVVNIPYNFALR